MSSPRAVITSRTRAESRRYARQVTLEPRFASLLPEVLLGLGASEFAALAARALTPRPEELVAVDHAHGGTVSVREQTALMHERLRRAGGASFRDLTADCDGTLEVVARFLGLLELYREGLVAFDQAEALAELRVRWTGPSTGDADLAEAAGAEWEDPVSARSAAVPERATIAEKAADMTDTTDTTDTTHQGKKGQD